MTTKRRVTVQISAELLRGNLAAAMRMIEEPFTTEHLEEIHELYSDLVVLSAGQWSE